MPDIIEPCPDCRHPWRAHQRAEGATGHRCQYTEYREQCSCMAANPDDVAEPDPT